MHAEIWIFKFELDIVRYQKHMSINRTNLKYLNECYQQINDIFTIDLTIVKIIITTKVMYAYRTLTS